MTLLLNCNNIRLDYPTKSVLDGVSLGINTGDRIGIVGGNGSGKSSLLSILAGTLAPDDGEVVRQGSVTIGVLSQRDSLDPEATVAHEVVGNVPEYTWAADREMRTIIEELLGDIPWEGLIKNLSGGQRRRVDLARLLIGDWDILMLDEPTNHLDMHAIAWLAEHLKTRWAKNAGALLVVTHDRWFLDEVCLSMWEVHDRRVDPFEGGYSAYILQRVERDRVARVTEQKRRNLMRKELAWLSRGAQARSTKPKFRVEAAWTLIEDEPPVRDPIELKRMAMARLGKQVIDVLDVTEIIDDKTILDDVTWLIGPGDRFGILGENGAGKTTLLNLIQGKLSPTKGCVRIGKTVKIAMLSQHLHELDEVASDRVRELLGRYKTSFVVDGKNLSPSQLLERLGFESAHLQARVSDLSGGQRRQLRLLMALMEEPNVLILDEPGNDLDTDMLAAVEDLLDSWPGTLLLVSHDRYLIERVTDSQFALIDGKLRHVPGGVDEYLALLDMRAEHQATSMSPAAAEPLPTPAANSGVSSSEAKSALSGGEAYQARKQLASIERKLETLEKQVEDTTTQMHQTDGSDYTALLEHQERITSLQAQISDLETQWVELTEMLG